MGARQPGQDCRSPACPACRGRLILRRLHPVSAPGGRPNQSSGRGPAPVNARSAKLSTTHYDALPIPFMSAHVAPELLEIEPPNSPAPVEDAVAVLENLAPRVRQLEEEIAKVII